VTMVQRVFQVPDATCQHCVKAITGELAKIPGVRSVDVDLERKLVTVTVEGAVPNEQIRAAIEEAGYEVTA